MAICYAIWYLIEFGLMIALIILAKQGLDLLDRKTESIDKLSAINECSDEYSNVEMFDLNSDFARGRAKQA